MMQTGLFWQNGRWARGIWLDQTRARRQADRNWLRHHYLWLDGELVSMDQAPDAAVPLEDSAGWWPGLRCYTTSRGPAIFRLHDYATRFLASPQLASLRPAVASVAALRRAICQTVQAHGYLDSLIRPVAVYPMPSGQAGDAQPGLGIVVSRWREVVSADTRQHGLTMRLARDGGGVTLLPEELPAAYTADHLLVVQDGVLCALSGAETTGSLVRDTALALAQDAGLAVMDAPLGWDALQAADEVLVCAASVEIAGVRAVNGQAVGNGRVGPITRRLQERYAETACGKNAYAARWLDYMDLVPLV